jgi:translation initiation factor 2 subunit 1
VIELVRKKDKYPSEGDLVICTVSKVSSHGAFANLDEYVNKDGFIHISEVASIWVKNIRDYVKEGQKTVAKVLSVDRDRGHIDLSVRRVGESQKTNKTQEWKRAQKAEKLLELAATEVKKTLDEAYKDVGFVLEGTLVKYIPDLKRSLFKAKRLWKVFQKFGIKPSKRWPLKT